MAKEKNIEESISDKLEKLIETKKDESSALKKIFESFEENKKSSKEKPNQKQ